METTIPKPVVATPTPKPTNFVKALWDFPPENARELELHVGDVVEVLLVVDEWMFGVFSDGREGYFPTNYCEKIGSW